MFQSDNLTEPRYFKGDLSPGQRYNVTVIAISHEEPSSLSVPVIFNTGTIKGHILFAYMKTIDFQNSELSKTSLFIKFILLRMNLINTKALSSSEF